MAFEAALVEEGILMIFFKIIFYTQKMAAVEIDNAFDDNLNCWDNIHTPMVASSDTWVILFKIKEALMCSDINIIFHTLRITE